MPLAPQTPPLHAAPPTHSPPPPQRYLSEALDAWESFGGGAHGKGARVFPAPYPLQAVAARPIMLDTAAGGIAYPSLAHRLCEKPAAEGGAQGSTIGSALRYFGWGGGGGGGGGS